MTTATNGPGQTKPDAGSFSDVLTGLDALTRHVQTLQRDVNTLAAKLSVTVPDTLFGRSVALVYPYDNLQGAKRLSAMMRNLDHAIGNATYDISAIRGHIDQVANAGYSSGTLRELLGRPKA